MNNPTIVLVPASWHSSAHYETLTTLLRAAGYPVVCYTLPSFDADDSKLYEDTAFVRDSMIMPSLDKGKDVVLVAHSYGGYPAGEASHGLGKKQREEGMKKGGVIGFIWITAALVNKGQTLKETMQNQSYPTWFVVDESVGRSMIAEPRDILYQDVDPALAIDAMVGLRPIACNIYNTPAEEDAGWANEDFKDRRFFLLCTKDKAITEDAQERSITNTHVFWDVKELISGHCPFLSMPKNLAEKITGAIAKLPAWEKQGHE